MKDFFPVLVILGLGGVVIYLLTRNQAAALPPAVDKTNMCGASYLGVGANVPCEYLGAGIKYLSGEAEKALGPLKQEVGGAVRGIQPWEVIVTPVAISHVAYNEVKRAVSWLNPF